MKVFQITNNSHSSAHRRAQGSKRVFLLISTALWRHWAKRRIVEVENRWKSLATRSGRCISKNVSLDSHRQKAGWTTQRVKVVEKGKLLSLQ